MSPTLEELENRVRLLEEHVAELIGRPLPQSIPEKLAERGARLLQQGRQSHPQLVSGWAKAMERMGINGEPISPESLQEMIAAGGVRPEDNEFSQALIEMREE